MSSIILPSGLNWFHLSSFYIIMRHSRHSFFSIHIKFLDAYTHPALLYRVRCFSLTLFLGKEEEVRALSVCVCGQPVTMLTKVCLLVSWSGNLSARVSHYISVPCKLVSLYVILSSSIIGKSSADLKYFAQFNHSSPMKINFNTSTSMLEIAKHFEFHTSSAMFA